MLLIVQMIGNQNKKKIIYNTNECIESCNNSALYKYEYNGKCYENCTYGFLFNDNDKCKCELKKCLTCTNIALKKNLCTKCNINYYPKEKDPLNVGEYINCYNQPQEGYYFDGSMFKNCYFTCKKCEGEGNELIHNCIECNENFSLGIKKDNYFNCYENCNYYHYFDNENNFHCTLNLSCPKEYPILNENKMECIKNNIQDTFVL